MNSFVTSGSLIHYASQRDDYTHKENHLVKSERLHPLEAIESYTYAIVPPYSEFLSHLWIWSLSETTSVVPPTDPWVPRMIMNFDSSRINVGSAVSLDLWILRYSICCVLLTIAPLNQANDAYG